jgi:predicted enzyme related to lactoylglutathione lyase
MAKVLGIGGVFFKAADPKAVQDWYARVLGFDVSEWGGATWPNAAGGQTVWSVFSGTSDHFDPSTQAFMVNYVVDDLEGILAKAKAEGAELIGAPTNDEYGRFGWLMDPAGVKIELWQPPAAG